MRERERDYVESVLKFFEIFRIHNTMPLSISDNNAIPFAKDFLKSFCASGFGSLPKREVDLLVLKLLLAHGVIDASSNAQGISRQIQLPLSKVKALLYELHLRDVNKDSAWLKNELTKGLKRSKLTVVGKEGEFRIEVGIENQLIRTEVEALLKGDGHYPDYSFNREILRLTPDAYATLIEFGLPDSDRKDILALLKNEMKKGKEVKDENSLLRLAIKKFVSHLASTVGDHFGDMSAEGLKIGIALLITQGTQWLR